MTVRLFWRPIIACLCFAAFVASAQFARHQDDGGRTEPLGGRIVITAPVQILLYAGDRFLGANLEAFRIATTGGSVGEDVATYLVRAHRVVAQLNPCQEDNYYLGNALLSWGGAQTEGNDLLRRATECRFWDEYPPFFLGVNLFFFQNDAQGAQRALEIAADRATANAAALRKFAIMIAAGEIDDDRMALAYLEHETEQASDPKLKDMLEKRVQRLQGLIALRDAQQRYEQRYGRPLANPQDLLTTGILDAAPTDPLRIGYEFRDGRFQLREIKILGLERRR